jgi:hypothetical protein
MELARQGEYRRERTNPIVDPGAWRIDAVQKQPPNPKSQSRSVATGRQSCSTRLRKPQTSSLRPSRGLGALYLQRLYFVTLPSAQVGQQSVVAHLRPPTTSYILRAETTQDGDTSGVKRLTLKGDYMFNFDLLDGLYALGINPADRD